MRFELGLTHVTVYCIYQLYILSPHSDQLTVMYISTQSCNHVHVIFRLAFFLNRDIVYLLSCFRFDIKSLTFEGEQDETGIKNAAANSECPMECAYMWNLV